MIFTNFYSEISFYTGHYKIRNSQIIKFQAPLDWEDFILKNLNRFLVIPKCEKLLRNILINGFTNDQRGIYT